VLSQNLWFSVILNSEHVHRLSSDGSFDLPDLRNAASAPGAPIDGDDGAAGAAASRQVLGVAAPAGSNWASSRRRTESSLSAFGSVADDAIDVGRFDGDPRFDDNVDGTSLWDNRGAAGLVSSGAVGSTSGLGQPTPQCGASDADLRADAGAALPSAARLQQPDAQGLSGGGTLAMLSDTVLAGHCWQYQPRLVSGEAGTALHDLRET
jgi:hypothetical protein